MQTNPDAIKDELKEVLAMEEDGKANQTLRLKKKALQGAYDNAIKKRKASLRSCFRSFVMNTTKTPRNWKN